MIVLLLLSSSCGSNQRMISPSALNEKPILTNAILSDSMPLQDPSEYSYLIENEITTLKNGQSEVEFIQGSASKKTTTYLGFDAFGDLNADQKVDRAVILTQNNGGSGVFYYVSVILADNIENQISNTFFLGDRIEIVSLEIVNEMLNVQFLERKENEPMSAKPGINKLKQLRLIDNKFYENQLIAPITFKEWRWVKTSMKNGEIISPAKNTSFTIIFNIDGKVTGKTDCNNFFGNYSLEYEKLGFTNFGSTKMYCENSLEPFFLEALSEVENYTISKDDRLLLFLKADAGTLMFE